MACSLCLNVELSTSYFCDNNYVKNDYLVVMVYVNNCCLENIYMFRIECKHAHVNQQNLAN
jgi:hypothetical protein